MYIVNSKDKCSWDHLKVRAFYYDNMEIIELISEKDEFEKVVLAHHEAPIGESLIDFCDGFDTDSSPVIAATKRIAEYIDAICNKTSTVYDLIGYVEELLFQMPYFCCMYAYMCNHLAKYRDLIFEEVISDADSIATYHYESAMMINNYMMVKENRKSDTAEESSDYDSKPMWLDLDTMKFEPLCATNGMYTVLPNIKGVDNQISEFRMDYVIYPTTVGDLINFITAEHIKRGIAIKKCKNCGRAFVSQRNNQIDYCDRVISNTGKTCRQLGAVRVYQNKQNENPIMREYTKAYKTHNARIRYGSITKEEFAFWSVEARKMRQRCMDGEITLEEFIEWLKD